MSEYTKGPWEVKVFPDGECFVAGVATEDHPYFRIMTERGNPIVEVMGDEDYPRKMADATLIAASPDLLEALQWLCNAVASMNPTAESYIDIDTPVMNAAKAAIKKARGER